MKAAQINNYGGASIISINKIEKPNLSDDQILVEVYASSLNPFDTTLRAGYMKEMIPLTFPATLGGDIAGIISEVGSKVNYFKPGDKVYGQAGVVAGNSGALAEFAATKAAQIAKMPQNLDFNQAASLPLVGVSALQALTEHLNLKSGQKIFIHGGAGGIGTIAIQIAKNIGAYVATTAAGDGIEVAQKLGADEIIDYKSQDYSEVLSSYDAVFDSVGDDFNKALGILKSGGIGVSMIAKADAKHASELGVTALTQATHVTTEKLNKLRELVEAGVVKPQIDKIFPLTQIREAFEARENGSIHGKVVIEIKKS